MRGWTAKSTCNELILIDRPVRLVFLYADVGGGHRAQAEAVREALSRIVGDRARVELVDALAQYAPFPLNRGRQTYTQAARFAPPLLGLFYHALDGPARIRLGMGLIRKPLRRAMAGMAREHPADLYVSFHPTYNYPLAWLRLPSVLVFSELVTNHALCCAPGAECYLLATNLARQRAIRHGVLQDRIHVTGLPVHPRFLDPIDPSHTRRLLGIQDQKPIIVVTGGSEGMGRVFDVAREIAWSRIDVHLVVITGRNTRLRVTLCAAAWPMPMHVLGFTHDMSDWMAIASVLISKSGASTIAEALVRGLPMILFGHVPGQEAGNSQFVADSGAGAYHTRPADVVSTLHAWLNDPSRMEVLASNARAVARPNAAFDVARIVYQIAADLAGGPAH